jgi:hypothetical protein
MTRRLLVAFACAAALALAGAVPAFGAGPWWRITSESAPSYLTPGGKGLIIVGANNLGDGEINGSEIQVRMTDRLPPGLVATQVFGSITQGGTSTRPPVSCSPPGEVLSCTYSGPLDQYERMKLEAVVKVEQPAGSTTTLANQVTVEGGGAPSATSSQPLTVSGEEIPFGLQRYELSPFNEEGTPDTQAGSHPFQLTTSLVLNQSAIRQPVALPKDLRLVLPPGLVGDPQAVERCTMANFTASVREANLCPPGTAVGVALATVNEPAVAKLVTKLVPVFNLVPAAGEPARFGFVVVRVPIILDTSVSSGDEYRVITGVNNLSQTAGVLSSQVTLWGIPGAASHDQARGWECVAGGYYQNQIGKPCAATGELSMTPFLTLPTSCAADPAEEPVSSSVEMDSWADPGAFLIRDYAWLSEEETPLGFTGCPQLPFSPSISLTAEKHTGSTPTGADISVRLPQAPTVEPNPQGRAEADVRDTTVTLPQGVQLNPSAANGLAACSQEQAGFLGFIGSGVQQFTPADPACPAASKLANVHIKTPLLAHELEGALYLAQPAPNGEAGQNPFNSLVAVYLVAEDPASGVLVKLAGKGELNPATGQLTTSFQDTPQLPFEELNVELFGGERASLSTPSFCGSYTAEASFTPWSGTGPVAASSPAEGFAVSEGCGASPLAFAPTFDAQATNPTAGAFTPFDVELTRPDGEQALTGVTVHLPAGVAALLSSVTPCQEPPAGQEWACGPESLIGQSTASSGLGGEPVVLGGSVYLTSGYDGAPFGLLVRTLAQAGPFDLGYVDVRSRIDVNPETAAVTITTDPGPRGEGLPSMLKGIPVQLKHLQIMVDRPNFEFNPTSCEPMRIEGTLAGSEGASASVSAPFQVGGCGSLPFAPKLTASAGGHGSKTDGTSLQVKIASPGLGQANIAKVDLQLPAALSTRNTTLQQACPQAVFDANPASCDEGSVIGQATVHTPVLKSPLSGPAYLVSHGGAAFPDVEFVLQGEGITLVLDGKTDIKNGITYSRFESAPDAPFTSFETILPAGPHSALTPNVAEKEDFSLCKTSLPMPTVITAQDGAVIEQTTAIAVSGCGEVKAAKANKPTRAQQLAKALKACRKKYAKNKHKRLACERQARKHYAPKSHAKSTHKASKTTKTASHNRT